MGWERLIKFSSFFKKKITGSIALLLITLIRSSWENMDDYLKIVAIKYEKYVFALMLRW